MCLLLCFIGCANFAFVLLMHSCQTNLVPLLFQCRYYINRVKDVYRQATFDLLLGNTSASELTLLRNADVAAAAADSGVDEDEGQVLVEKEENLKTLIDECKKMLITEPEECLGGWGLIDCDPETGDPAQQDMDIILLLSQKAYYVARYYSCWSCCCCCCCLQSV